MALSAHVSVAAGEDSRPYGVSSIGLAPVAVGALLAWTWLSDGETRRQRHFAKQSPETQHARIARERAMRGIKDAVQPKRADEDA